MVEINAIEEIQIAVTMPELQITGRTGIIFWLI
jgi:hypothetical protein